MKKFFEDYKDLCKHSGRFYKNHWLGTVVVTAVGLGLSFTPLVIWKIKQDRELREIENPYIKEYIEAEEEIDS